MNIRNKVVTPDGKRRLRALEREKMHVRLSIPDLVAREAAELASRRHENRMSALDDIRRRITRGQTALFERAFFECLADWLGERQHQDATDIVRDYIASHLAPTESS
ncbi:hypothetical protein [Pararobbsia silviterrae]|uniref:Uncharacterized protein n=1 Tax=Pararobbsia silviterrae TaxID=1792498 RepID=A0A494Y6Q3_9BURK|nr:hypothetical protein [Pararobbsia silviterrae]RKP58401.1 hypothetical protein D7S86_00055 [Pararobbsia silviterrae]